MLFHCTVVNEQNNICLEDTTNSAESPELIFAQGSSIWGNRGTKNFSELLLTDKTKKEEGTR
jgi:hypothetical protein